MVLSQVAERPQLSHIHLQLSPRLLLSIAPLSLFSWLPSLAPFLVTACYHWHPHCSHVDPSLLPHVCWFPTFTWIPLLFWFGGNNSTVLVLFSSQDLLCNNQFYSRNTTSTPLQLLAHHTPVDLSNICSSYNSFRTCLSRCFRWMLQ